MNDSERERKDARVWMTPQVIEGVQLLHARHSAREWTMWHDSYALALVHAVRDSDGLIVDGAARWFYRNAERSTSRGQVMTMTAGSVHATRNPKGEICGDFDVIMIAPDIVQRVAEELEHKGSLHLAGASMSDPRLVSAIAQLLANAGSHDQALREECVINLVSVMLSCCVESAQDERDVALSRVQIKRTLEVLLELYDQPLTLAEIARHVGARPSTISHDISKVLGVSPIRLLRNIRCARAVELIVRDVPLSEVFGLVGLPDQPKLTAVVREGFGVTPGKIQRMAKYGL